jgi:hypothetical protein
MKVFDAIFTISGVIGLIIILGLIMSIPTWFLWNNCFVDAVHGVNQIGIVQAWGLNILAGLLFKSNITKKD